MAGLWRADYPVLAALRAPRDRTRSVSVIRVDSETAASG